MAFPTNFADLPRPLRRYAASRVVVLPVPFERTVSYGKGTGRGPAAILRASHFVETWDEELRADPSRQGIATLPPFRPRSRDLGRALGEVQSEVARHLRSGKFVVTLGGEHSLSVAPVRAVREVVSEVVPRGEIGVVQFDAHADLREEYEGTAWSHASVMRRIVELGVPTLAVGIRSLSEPEARFIEEQKLPILWGHELERAARLFGPLLDRLPERVYLTFDLDFFDPSLVPATGTPEPGGGRWYPTLALLRELFRRKTVVAMDVVELAPHPGQPASDFVAAKLAYKCLGYLAEAEGRLGG
jgi:agmatinase